MSFLDDALSQFMFLSQKISVISDRVRDAMDEKDSGVAMTRKGESLRHSSTMILESLPSQLPRPHIKFILAGFDVALGL
ncbi:hypothetical protein A0H81_09470 [Grifola frondosa]|uniref:Uncharacterized protein n=1 Tax=Grifola frondosa TaxID=5627 RepID=A0A1C7M315_GRIFR|nr:hypothetical protein A0H81_09470 [Grifola frondosa]